MTAPAPTDRPVVLTGAAGFIGSHLARALLSWGATVVGIDNFDGFYSRSIKQHNVEQCAGERFQLVEADICDAEAVRRVMSTHRPEVVFHIAALAGVRPSIEDPARYCAVNLDGLVNVLEAARDCGCSRVVFASSSSVYGNNSKTPFAEDDPVNAPISPYAATKRAGELLCHTYAHLYGLSIGALRFFTVFGPAQRPDLAISTFMRRMAAGRSVPMFGDGATSRDYTYIDDIIAGVLAAQRAVLAMDDGAFRIWNLGGSHPVRLSEMIEAIGRVLNITPKIEQLPMQPGDVQRTWADLSRSKAELGYEPTTDFTTGLQRQWDWLQQNMHLFDEHDARSRSPQPA